MSVNPSALREAMRYWATGVTVVTAQNRDERHGMTVSSFTSVSLNPPLVLVSLERNTRTHRLVKNSEHFGVTILDRDQQELSDRFAGRSGDSEDRFTELSLFTLKSGVPFIQNGLAYFDCKVLQSVDIHTHTVFIGEVTAVQTNQQNRPLLYFDRNYHRLQE